MSNRCGKCSACCTVFSIDVGGGLFKKSDVQCRFVNEGGGCLIYQTRPNACRHFQCEWLQWLSADTELRPDRVGVMMDRRRHYLKGIGGWIIFMMLWELEEGALADPLIQDYRTSCLDAEMVVIERHFPVEGERREHLIVPDGFSDHARFLVEEYVRRDE